MSAHSFPLRGNPGAAGFALRFSGGEHYPHALLIEGPAGSGKSTFARHLAMALLCRAQTDRPCKECPACHKIAIGGHPDLLVYESEKKTARSFHVDLVREARAQAFVRPNESDVKVLLLEDCETMTEQAQNALLKVLEEPPATAVFLLTCRNRAELLETIRSRAACITLELPGAAACAEILAERFPDRPEQELRAAAEQAQGSVGAAIGLLEGGGEGAAHREAASKLLERIAAGDEYGALLLLVPYERDRPGFTRLLEDFRAHVSGRILEGDSGKGAAKINRLQLYAIAAIIEEAQGAVRSNVGGLILGASLVARCMAAVSEPASSRYRNRGQ